MYNAQWTAGQTYTNGTYGLSVTVVSRSGSTFVVTVANAATPTITAHPASQSIAFGQTASLSVAASGSGLTYQWYRGASGVTTAPVAGATSSSYTRPPLISNTIYWVRVSNVSGASDSSGAVVTVAFTDSTLTPTSSTITTAHIAELRARIDALRSRYSLSAYPYADTTLSAAVTPIQAQHVADLRTALNQVYDAAHQTRPTFTDAALTSGSTAIKAIHIAELRTAVTTLE